NIRYVVPPLKAVTKTGYLAQPIHKPVFSYRPYEVDDEEAAAATSGGLESPLLGLSDGGRAYAAVRFTMLTEQSSPLIVQVVDESDESVIVRKEISARKGETVEDYAALDITEPGLTVRAQ